MDRKPFSFNSAFLRLIFLSSRRYPSVTSSGNLPAYTGPSVESVAAPSTSTISGGKLAAAVAIPLLVIVGLLAAYVGWNKWKKREVKKRWSAVSFQFSLLLSALGTD